MPAADRARFAFLIHPRTDIAADLALINPVLGLVPGRFYEAVTRRLPVPSWVHATIGAADRAGDAFGEVIAVPLTPAQMLGPDRRLVERRVAAAVDLAVSRGATIVGLGALTAPVTAGGAKLRHRTDVGVTNGNAYTAAITAQQVVRIARGRDRTPVVALVGATGSVGSAVARVLARDGVASELLLVGRSTGQLAALADALPGRSTVSSDIADCRRADVIVLMTSAVDALLLPEHVGEGAVVLDDTQPRNTSPRLAAQRPDVLVVDGGVVATPGLHRRGRGIGVPADSSFACLAETALLALDGHRGHGTIGRPSLAQVDRLTRIAGEQAHLGFGVAEPTSFGVPVTVPGWSQPALRKAAVRA